MGLRLSILKKYKTKYIQGNYKSYGIIQTNRNYRSHKTFKERIMLGGVKKANKYIFTQKVLVFKLKQLISTESSDLQAFRIKQMGESLHIRLWF